MSIAKRAFQAKKAGHAGTLDPLASGVLPIAFGDATKTVPVVFDGRKTYRFTVRWGIETDTDDAEGRAVSTSEARPDEAAIRALLPQFTGEIAQVPPRYSAIKIDGERAYDLARDGEVVELEARPVFIETLTLLGLPDADHAEFEAICGKGTYVRAIARDMGRLLGCGGHVSALRRTAVGPFTVDGAVPIEPLEALRDADEAARADGARALLRPIESALSALLCVAVSQNDAARLHRGQPVLLRGRDAPVLGGQVYVTAGGELVALAEIEQGELVPKRVFKPAGARS